MESTTFSKRKANRTDKISGEGRALPSTKQGAMFTNTDVAQPAHPRIQRQDAKNVVANWNYYFFTSWAVRWWSKIQYDPYVGAGKVFLGGMGVGKSFSRRAMVGFPKRWAKRFFQAGQQWWNFILPTRN